MNNNEFAYDWGDVPYICNEFCIDADLPHFVTDRELARKVARFFAYEMIKPGCFRMFDLGSLGICFCLTEESEANLLNGFLVSSYKDIRDL